VVIAVRYGSRYGEICCVPVAIAVTRGGLPRLSLAGGQQQSPSYVRRPDTLLEFPFRLAVGRGKHTDGAPCMRNRRAFTE
jgi:hypothetical protein